MAGRFVDTNVLLYAANLPSEDPGKRARELQILAERDLIVLERRRGSVDV